MNPRSFKLHGTPLRPGARLLEANAGTGKTYTISGLVCRLVVEEGLDISNILVVTFTEAATEELKDRIRKYLHKVLTSLKAKRPANDLAEVYQKLPANQRDRAMRRLKTALGLFDEAAIFTIHGFCHRVLLQFAFECNRLFESQLVKDPKPFYNEISHDYWRRHFYRGDPFLAALVHSLDLSPKNLVGDFIELNRLADPCIIPPVSNTQYSSSLSEVRTIWEDLSDLNRNMKGVFEILGNEAAFKKPLRDQIPEILQFLERPWPQTPTVPAVNILRQLTGSNVKEQRMKKAAKHGFNPRHPFFDKAENWQVALEYFRHQHRFFSLDQFRRQLEQRKDQLNLITFDDLLPRVVQALDGPSGDRLKSRLRGQYTAALIDEFQDTDPQQYRMFSQLFAFPHHHLYFIGDPKQAIYTFRGADIFSYLEARKSARETFGLTRNWRSDPKLVAGINWLFKWRYDPFVFPEIPFNPSDSAVKGGQLKDAHGRDGAGLKCCYISSAQEGKPINNGEAKELIRMAVVREILYLVQGGGLLRERPVKPGDIAILTRTNQEAHEVRAELSAVNLPCVIHSDKIIFETEEAKTMRILLHALFEPLRRDRFKAAMVSEWMGFRSNEIYSMEADWEHWEPLRQCIHQCHETWLTRGIYLALNHCIEQFGIPVRLLRMPEGERKMANLMHLVDLLQKAESEGRTTPQTLLAWYEETLQDPDRERDDFLMRLETDEEAIQVLTIHKSKGLQYPIVFVPFAWRPPSSTVSKGDHLVFHDPDDTRRVVVDAYPKPSPVSREQHAREELSDSLRLLYVALTRAQFRTYFFLGDFKNQDRSSIGYLLGMVKPTTERPVTLAKFWKRFIKMKPKGIEILDFETMAGRHVATHQRYEHGFELFSRSLTRKLEPGFSIASFSSLSTGFSEAAEDFDETIPEEQEGPDYVMASPDIFSLPRGPLTGNVIHQIFQYTDFQNEDTLRLATKEACDQHYAGNDWTKILHNQLNLVLHKPLGSASRPVVLSQLGPDSCIKETEFHFPAKNCFSKDLARILLKYPDKFSPSFVHALPHLKQQKVNGFLRGIIDLVFEQHGQFFLLDWKSNWLGPSTDDYDLFSLGQIMGKHAYYLQYYLYTVALIRYLRGRIPSFDYNRDFGGVYYLFVRGVGQNSESNGIFFDKPPRRIIAEIDSFFAENREHG